MIRKGGSRGHGAKEGSIQQRPNFLLLRVSWGVVRSVRAAPAGEVVLYMHFRTALQIKVVTTGGFFDPRLFICS